MMRDHLLDAAVLVLILAGAVCIPLSDAYTRGRLIHAVVNRLPQSPAEQAATWIVNNSGAGLTDLPDDTWDRLNNAANRRNVSIEQYMALELGNNWLPNHD